MSERACLTLASIALLVAVVVVAGCFAFYVVNKKINSSDMSAFWQIAERIISVSSTDGVKSLR